MMNINKNLKKKIVLFSVVHPKSYKYFYELINNIKKQNTKDFSYFICFNNIIPSKKAYNELKKINLHFIIFITNKTPGIARKQCFYKLSNSKFTKIIFLDSDDLIEKGRIKTTAKYLDKFDYVVNNIIKFKKKLNCKKLFINKKNLHRINFKDLITDNFVGFSNLAINTCCLKKIYKQIDFNLVALDWCLSSLLTLNNQNGIFLRNVYSYYRQYDGNISNFNINSKLKIINDIKIIYNHYKFLKKYNSRINKYCFRALSLLSNSKNNSFIKLLKKNKSKNNYYWWGYITSLL
jgi:hypothetical protein